MTKKRYYYIEGWKETDVLPTTSKKGRTMIALPQRAYGVDEDIARLFARKRLKKKLAGGWTSYKDWSVKSSKVINVPKSFIRQYLKHPPKKKEDFIDRLIGYESGELSPEEDIKFLEEVEKKGLGGKLQGHYGRAIQRKNLLKARLRRRR